MKAPHITKRGWWLFLLCLSILFFILFTANSIHAQTEEDIDSLRAQIDEKTKELEAIAAERDKLEQQLEEVGHRKRSLSNEVANINYRINHLNFSIDSNRITLDKLALELESLQQDIESTEQNIERTKQTVGDLLVKMQQIEDQTLLVVLLRNSSLTASLSEVQAIMTIGESLTDSINKLLGLKSALQNQIKEVADKKRASEIERETLIHRQNLVEEQKQDKQYLLSQTRSQELTYEKNLDELEEQQQEISDIISRIEEKLRESFDPDLLPAQRPGVIAFPVQDPLVTQCFGKTEFAERAYRSQSHTGMDFRAPIGTPIFAVASGRVSAVDNNDGSARWEKFQYGKYVVLDHDNNLSSLYSHLSRWVVQEGETVKQGDLIGYSGATGYITGPHLHFGLYWTPSMQYEKIPPASGLVPVGVTIDPAAYLLRESNVENCL